MNNIILKCLIILITTLFTMMSCKTRKDTKTYAGHIVDVVNGRIFKGEIKV